MQIILLDRIPRLGNLGDQINVKSGYARNFLIPNGKAILATKKNLKYFEERRAKIEAQFAEILSIAESRAKKISELTSITISSKAGSEGKLFGSIGARDIANVMAEAGVKVSKSEIRLPNGPLRSIGEYNVSFQIHSEVIAKLVVKVIAK